MPRNPGNRHRDIKIYPDANLKFVRMEFTENKKDKSKRKTRWAFRGNAILLSKKRNREIQRSGCDFADPDVFLLQILRKTKSGESVVHTIALPCAPVV